MWVDIKRKLLSKGIKCKANTSFLPLSSCCCGEHALRFLLWEPSGFVPMPLTRGGCTVSTVEVEGRCTICLPCPVRGMAEGSPHPSSSLTLKGLAMFAGQFKCRISFWVQTGPGFRLKPLCLFSTCKTKPLRRSHRCPDHHLFNGCFGNW